MWLLTWSGVEWGVGPIEEEGREPSEVTELAELGTVEWGRFVVGVTLWPAVWAVCRDAAESDDFECARLSCACARWTVWAEAAALFAAAFF